MQDYIKAKMGKIYCFPVSSASISSFDPLSSQSHTPKSINFCVFTDRLKKQYIPSLPLGLALTYLKDLKNASKIHKIMQH